MTVTQCHQIAFPHPKDCIIKNCKLKVKGNKDSKFSFFTAKVFFGYGDFEARGIVQISNVIGNIIFIFIEIFDCSLEAGDIIVI